MARRLALWLLVAWAVACGGGCGAHAPLAIGDALPALAPLRMALEPDAHAEELIGWLQAYLRVDTQNPPGNETAGARWMAGLLEREGIASEIVEFAPGRGSLIARLPATATSATTGERPLCLLSHIDTVTSEIAKWPADSGPLSGVRKGGEIWGRGALDMKGMGILELAVMVHLKRRAVPLRREVILLAVADEEVDNLGMKHLVAQHWDRIGCSHLLNEGGIAIEDALAPGQTFFAISVAEKGLLWLKLTAHGKSGHGSTPIPGRAPDRLLDALAKVRALAPPTQIHPSLYASFAAAGRDVGGVVGFVLQRPSLVDLLAVSDLRAEPGTRAAIENTCQITGFSGMFAPNVVPSEVSAQLDCRLLPGVAPRAFLAELQRAIGDPAVHFTVIHEAAATESPMDDPLFRTLLRHAPGLGPRVVAGPVLSVGFTDSIYVRPLGVRAYGFVPLQVSRALAETMHGERERVPEATFVRGLGVLWRVIIDAAAAPPAAGASGAAAAAMAN